MVAHQRVGADGGGGGAGRAGGGRWTPRTTSPPPRTGAEIGGDCAVLGVNGGTFETQ